LISYSFCREGEGHTCRCWSYSSCVCSVKN